MLRIELKKGILHFTEYIGNSFKILWNLKIDISMAIAHFVLSSSNEWKFCWCC